MVSCPTWSKNLERILNVQRFSTEMIKVNFTSFHPKNLDDRFDQTDARCSWNLSLFSNDL